MRFLPFSYSFIYDFVPWCVSQVAESTLIELDVLRKTIWPRNQAFIATAMWRSCAQKRQNLSTQILLWKLMSSHGGRCTVISCFLLFASLCIVWSQSSGSVTSVGGKKSLHRKSQNLFWSEFRKTWDNETLLVLLEIHPGFFLRSERLFDGSYTRL